MEILLVYLYGIYDSVYNFIGMSMIISIIVSLVAVAVAFFHKDMSSIYHKDSERYRELISNYESSKKFIFLKTSIMLIIINVLFPPKEIAVAMVIAPKVVEITKDIADSNRTKKIVNVIDLGIDRITDKLKEK